MQVRDDDASRQTNEELHMEKYRIWDNLTNQGVKHLEGYRATGEVTRLHAAVTCFLEAEAIVAQGVGNAVYTLGSLGNVFKIRFEQNGDRGDLDQAIVYYQSALELTPPGNSDRPLSLNNLSKALKARFQQIGNRADLDQAIVYLQEALGLTPFGHSNRFFTLENLGNALLARFEQVGDSTELDQAIVYLQSALDLTPLDHPDRSSNLTNLANTIYIRFEQMGDRTDLDQAVISYQTALALTPPGHPNRALSLNNLANCLMTRFEQSGDNVDLGQAITYLQSALELAAPGFRSSTLFNLANTLLTRFQQAGEITDLDQAIVYYQAALDLTPPGHHLRSPSLANLASGLVTRFEEVGDRANLDQAIVYLQNALDLTPSGHPDRFSNLTNLANAIKTRFEQLGDRVDLDQAIVYYQSAVDLTPSGHPDRSLTLNNFALGLEIRFEQIGDLADLDRAIAYFQAALDLTPPGHPNRSISFHNLANTLKTRFERIRNRVDLDQAIVYYQSALDLTPPGHPYRFLSLQSLATCFVTCSQLLGDRVQLDQAIAFHQDALDLTPVGHPKRSSCLSSLAAALTIRLAHSTDEEPTNQAISASNVDDCRANIIHLLRDACSITTGPLDACLAASLMWIDVATQWSDPSAFEAYRISLELLESVLSTGRSLESRHLRNSSIQAQKARTIAVDSAAFALESGRIEVAVELLEQGRGVLSSAAGKYRTRIDELETIHPILAAEFRLTSVKMSNMVMTVTTLTGDDASPSEAEDVVAAYQRLSEKWTNVVKRIRATPEFSTFLQPTPFTILRTVANGGPVIVVNYSRRRTDAIILRSESDPYLVPLPRANQEVTRGLLDKAHHRAQDRDFQALLGEIWRTIVQPVVRVLQEDVKLPLGSRIWWCPTGATSHLPLHAAGDYEPSGQILSNLYVSSYTPTLSALLRARQQPPPETLTTLIIGQSETPGHAELPSVPLEIDAVKSSVDQTIVLQGANATRDSVLQEIGRYPRIHLACHGHVNQKHPFRSKFSLHDGPLTLLDVMRQTLPQADLAFLSACHSAEGNRDQPDEMLHLAAGMQFAGFRSVVGTMWAVCDLDGPKVAEAFYSSLHGTQGRPVAKSSAHALHRAVAELRTTPGVSYSRWSCFVHFGC